MRKLSNIIIYTINFIMVSLVFIYCKSRDCSYIEINTNCIGSSLLNISTGIGVNDSILKPGPGIVDPYWRVLNNPPLVNCTSPLQLSINGSAYVINLGNTTGWVNQVGASVLAPVDLGTTNQFSCNNATNTKGIAVPYIFERPFCLLENSCLNFDFTFQGDDQVYFEIYDNSSNIVIKNSQTYIWSTSPPSKPLSWRENNICLMAGSYSIRAYLINTNSTILGFSLLGSITNTSEKNVISNNKGGCCENNVISILNILNEKGNCNNSFDNSDTFGTGWTFNIKDSNGATIKSGQTDENGNLIFSGLSDGNYTVNIIPQSGWTPNSTTIPISLSNNTVKKIEFYN